MQTALQSQVIRGPHVTEAERVLTPDALAFVLRLHHEFDGRRRQLLARRQARWARLRGGEKPDFLRDTEHVRSSEWQVASVPPDLDDRRVEITGPVDRKMLINALNSGARVFMADFEDSLSPTWQNVVEGQANLQDAVRRTLSFTSSEGKHSATLLTSDVDERDRAFTTGERTAEGYFRVRSGIDSAIARAISYGPYADVLWCETSTPDIAEAKQFADAVHERFPGKLLAYNCSPSFNWAKHLDAHTIARFQNELNAMGYKFQFITLAGWHLNNLATFELASDYEQRGMSAYVDLQQREFALEEKGYGAVRHQREAGVGYFDQVLNAITGGASSTAALTGSTEAAQFAPLPPLRTDVAAD